MSEKALKSMKDENQDLQKHIGCITGFFQLFDRQRFLTSSSQSQHRPISGGSINDIKELNSTMQKAKERNLKVAREKQQFFTESSTTSISSSSCSSSMSSLEFNRTIQTESPSTSQTKIPNNLGQQYLDFNDIVKDSMNREAQGLCVKTVAKDQKKGQKHTLKHLDSPRPLQSKQSINAGVVVANEPFHILAAKSKKIPWDSPRLSYDGRITQDTYKAATKHKELPRLSLDSREGNKSRNLLKAQHEGYGKNSSTMLNHMQEPETSRRSSGVVAKLMGLEALPDKTQIWDTPPGSSGCYNSKNELLARSRTSDEYKKHTSSQLQASKGSESNRKASKSSLTVYGEIEKRLAELEFKKSGKDLRALKQILEAMQRYNEPFDIRRDQTSNSSSDNSNSTSLNESSKVQSPRLRPKDPKTQGSKLPIVIMKSAKVHRRLVDKQTARDISSIRKKKDPFSQHINPADKNNNMRASKLMQSSKVPQDSNGGNTNFGNMIVTGSPRLQKKFGLERRSPPSSPSSDSCINRRHHNRSSMELSSPSTAHKQKFSNLHQRNEHFSELSCHRRDFKHQGYVISPEFDRKRSSATHNDIEVIHIEQSRKINSNSIQMSGLNQDNAFEDLRKERTKAETTSTPEQPSPVSVLDAAFYTEDPPSPVKKKSGISKDLGEALSTDDDNEENSVNLHLFSSTTKANFSNGSGDRGLNRQNLVKMLQENDWTNEEFINLSDNKDPDRMYISEILLASGLLSGPSSGKISHSPGRAINPKLFFALEQMKSDRRQYHIEDSSTKKIITRIISQDQMQRKLKFDVVNEILVRRLTVERSSTLWCQPNDLAGRKFKGQKLLDKLCTEIDQLQPQNWNDSQASKVENLTSLFGGDLMHHPTIWSNCCSEIPNIVLDIERLIFKDLITEVVRGEVPNHPAGRNCRKLFFSQVGLLAK